MSNRYKGGIISATPPTTNGPFEDGAASGAWTLEQQMQAAAAGTWPLAGNVSPDAFIENLFQTWLYTGNDAYQAINNGIDLAGKGGLVWSKSRSTSGGQFFYDSARGATTGNAKSLTSNTTAAQVTTNPNSMNFISSGFELASNASSPGNLNASGETAVSWTFRKQPKFFDVVTYTGDGVSGRAIPHNLGSAPGFMIIKITNAANDWICYHRSLGASQDLALNKTDQAFNASAWANTTPTSTEFYLGNNGSVNGSGFTYVAYLFAHDAGGFGLTGTDNVISCGSYTGTGAAGNFVTLGFEPQWVMIKRTDASANWRLFDSMRGMPVIYASGAASLSPDLADAESSGSGFFPTATGFSPADTTSGYNASGGTYIYIAIRRGPMKVPTTGTSVFAPVTQNTGTNTTVTTNFPVDKVIGSSRAGSGHTVFDRLRGTSISSSRYIDTNSTSAEASVSGYGLGFDNNTGYVDNYFNYSDGIFWNFRRAPGFFDEVCYTSTAGFAASFTHNLGVTPELIIFKNRQTGGGSGEWTVYSAPTGNNSNLVLNTTSALVTNTGFIQTLNSTTVLTGAVLPQANQNYVSYLFATCPGVSKVGSYTGTAATQVINCGFTGGARFILIKRTDASGDWYVWDSARGIVAGDDPYLLLNSTAAEVTNTDYVDTAATGFEITSTAPAAINASGGTFVFLAIA
jgi:hypothetical protein